ncbi:hypothetical protein B0H14DRAFT_2564637 [Mycena olivaceomarginata]|nr:hypothetical protein B0H14DRAFT_2564637 [Mycena olivaceomarginata]
MAVFGFGIAGFGFGIGSLSGGARRHVVSSEGVAHNNSSTERDDNEVESCLWETLKSLKKPCCKANLTIIVDEDDGDVEMDPPADDRAGSPPPEKSAEGKGKGKARTDVEQKNKQKKEKETDDEPAEAEKGQDEAQPWWKREKPDVSTDAGPSVPLTHTRAKRKGATSTQDAAGAPKPKPRAREKKEDVGKDMADEVPPLPATAVSRPRIPPSLKRRLRRTQMPKRPAAPWALWAVEFMNSGMENRARSDPYSAILDVFLYSDLLVVLFCFYDANEFCLLFPYDPRIVQDRQWSLKDPPELRLHAAKWYLSREVIDCCDDDYFHGDGQS